MTAFPSLLTVSVSAEDIRDGVRGSCGSCPIALASMRAASVPAVRVGRWTIGILNDELFEVATYALPREGAGLLLDFDVGNECKPVTFEARRVS